MRDHEEGWSLFVQIKKAQDEHELPLLFCLTYPAIVYLVAILLYPCDGTQDDYSNNICGLVTCYLVYDKVLGTLDW
jgi:hypothetical protein